MGTATIGAIFRGGNVAGPVPTNQVCRSKFNPAEPFARRDWPDLESVQQHVRIFCAERNVDEISDVPPWTGLDPDGRYYGPQASEHPIRRPLWTLAGPGAFVAPVFALIREVTALTKSGSVAPGDIWHSHFKGVKGGALDILVLVNREAAGGSAPRNVVLDAEEVAMILARDPTDSVRQLYLSDIHRRLAEVRA